MKKKSHKPILPSDTEIVNWLSACAKIDQSGYDSGYAFERLIYPMDKPGAGVCDVRIAVRGFDGEDGLRKAVHKAILVEEELSRNPYKSQVSHEKA